MFNASKTTRANSSCSQGEKANTRKVRSLTQPKRSSSLLTLESRTTQSTSLTDPCPNSDKSPLRSPRSSLTLRHSEHSDNCRLTKIIRERENSEQRLLLRLRLKRRNESKCNNTHTNAGCSIVTTMIFLNI